MMCIAEGEEGEEEEKEEEGCCNKFQLPLNFLFLLA